MFGANGLYGHIQRNNAKTALLASGFVVLFLATHMLVRILVTTVTLIMDRNPGHWGLVGVGKGPGIFTWPMGAGGTGGASGVFSVTADPLAADKLKMSIDVLTPEALFQVTSGFGLIGQALPHVVFFDLESLLIIVMGIATVAWGTWRNSWLLGSQIGARPLARHENRALFEMVDNLAITAGMPAPKIEVIDSPAMNAYATGLTTGASRIGLTRGLIEGLDRDELETIIAHEMTHVRQGDSRLMAVAKSCLDITVPYRNNPQFKTKGQILLHIVIGAIGLGMLFGPAVYLALAAFFGGVALFAFLIKATILHAREFIADAGAVELTKNPAALVSALLKIARKDEKLDLSTGAMAIMFHGVDGGLLSTHPPVDARIAAIREHARLNGYDVTAHRNRRLDSVAGAQPSEIGAGFGKRRDAALAKASNTHAIQSEARAIWKDAPVFKGKAAAPEQTLVEEISNGIKSVPGRLMRGVVLYVAFLLLLTIGSPIIYGIMNILK